MNGIERRKLEFTRPETSITTEELQRRKAITKKFLTFGCKTILIIMVLEAIIVAYTATRYQGYEAFYIAFFGCLLILISNLILAYIVGTKFGKIYKTMIQGK